MVALFPKKPLFLLLGRDAPVLGRRRGKNCLFPFAFFSENAFNATFIPRRRIGFKIKIEKLQEKNQVTDRGPAGQ